MSEKRGVTFIRDVYVGSDKTEFHDYTRVHESIVGFFAKNPPRLLKTNHSFGSLVTGALTDHLSMFSYTIQR